MVTPGHKVAIPVVDDAGKRFIRSNVVVMALIIAIVVTGFVGFSLFWNTANLKQQQVELATTEAEANWNKDLVFRRWATRHGGVYVKPDERTPPNPYLAHIPERDIETRDGTRLTLMNPAYMLSQMTREFEQLYGVKGKITGKVLLNPDNKPDEWEFGAITQFEQGKERVVEQTSISGQPYLRFMKPIFMTQGCVKCHGFLGFKEGDLRGGISVSIPLAPYFVAAEETSDSIWITHALVWIVAMLAIFLFTFFAAARTRERVALLNQLKHDAFHDSLTQLPNRDLFTDRLDHAIRRFLREPQYRFAVCFLDMDRFKNLNDSYGHIIGDRVLLQIAERFKKILRPTDSVARIGGDEFTFLLESVSGLNESIVISERILGCLHLPFHTGVGEVYMNASMGVCVCNENYTSAVDMLRDADIALYRAKAQGKGRVDVFNQDMHEKAKKIMQMENDLRIALQRQQLELYYQPIINCDKNRIFGFEALLRWQHPELGFIAPDVFIPIAEDTGLIGQIGDWVMQQACHTVRDWNLEFGKGNPFVLSVNLSAKQLLQAELVKVINQTLVDTRFDPQLLHCELTETSVIQHREQGRKVINELRSIGASISVDDFGKGYSSLTYLQEFNFDTLKIDKDFVQDMSAEGKGLQLVKTIMYLARDFNMKVVAEGVEELHQLDRLKAFGCKLIQGYLYSRPLPGDQVYALLEQGLHNDANSLRANQASNDVTTANSPSLHNKS